MFPINFDITKLKKGDEFSDGFGRHTLEFIEATTNEVFALFEGKKVIIQRTSLEINGYFFPKEETLDLAVGHCGLEDRRKVNLTLIKTKYKDIPRDAWYCVWRKDRCLLLPFLEPFENYYLEGSDRDKQANREELNIYIYIVKDANFVAKENKRIAEMVFEHKKACLIEKIQKTKKEAECLIAELKKMVGE